MSCPEWLKERNAVPPELRGQVMAEWQECVLLADAYCSGAAARTFVRSYDVIRSSLSMGDEKEGIDDGKKNEEKKNKGKKNGN